MQVTPEGIRNAREAIRPHVRQTALVRSPLLSRVCECDLYLKCEHQQLTGSFKERGACNKLLRLSAEERGRGVIAASAGNHALGLSYHGQQLGVGVTVVMPRLAPIVKVSQCRSYGAEVELFGESFDEARRHALERARAERLCFVHGFDDPVIIEGQGSVGLEISEQAPDLDTVLIPSGGGGLLAGMAVALEAVRPELEIVAVEAENAPTLSRAFEAGAPVDVEVRPSLADGLAVARAGTHAFALAEPRVARVERVSEPEIASAIVRLMETEKAVVEGAGAVALAYALRRPAELRDRRVLAVLSGGNVDLNIVSRIIERGLVSAGRLYRFSVDLEDHPGFLAKLLGLVSEQGANILQVQHDRNFGPADVAKVSVTVVVETSDHAHSSRLKAALERAGWGSVGA